MKMGSSDNYAVYSIFSSTFDSSHSFDKRHLSGLATLGSTLTNNVCRKAVVSTSWRNR